MRKAYLQVFCFMLFLVISEIAYSTVIKVPSHQPNINAAISAAAEGDTVLVASGTYSGVGNHDLNFGGKNLVLVSENGLSETIIDILGNEQNYRQGFIFENGENESSIIEGFTIINGYTIETGGAISCNNSSPTIKKCLFENNFAYVRGGAVYCVNNSTPLIENCTFKDNTSSNFAGALYFHFGSDGEVKNCKFTGNSSKQGGAITCDKSSPNFENCFITNNSAVKKGGGVFIQDNCQSNFINCTIVNNSAYIGSGFFIQQRYLNMPVNINIHNSIIAYNKQSLPLKIAIDSFYIDLFENMQINLSCTDIFSNQTGDWEIIQHEKLIKNNSYCSLLKIHFSSQVDLEIIAPNGEIVSRDNIEINAAGYIRYEIFPGDTMATILIPEPIEGVYQINVIPHPDSAPDDEYSIYAQSGWGEIIYDFKEKVSDISETGYQFEFNNCCLGLRGNVNGDNEQIVDIDDLVYMIDFQFNGGQSIPCIAEGDISPNEDPDGAIDIDDLVDMVTFQFDNGTPPGDCP